MKDKNIYQVSLGGRNKAILIFSFIIFSVQSQSVCDKPSYSLGACQKHLNQTRSAYLYFDEENQCETTPFQVLEPIDHIPCNYSCEPGEFFQIDTQKRQYGCKKCPKNTYSYGGGFHIDGYFGEWDEKSGILSKLQENKQVELHCYSYYWWMWLEMDCDKCSPSSGDGSKLICGVASAQYTMVAYEIVFNIVFEKPGTFEILYKKDTNKDSNGQTSGTVKMYVDSDRVLIDEDVDGQNKWKFFSADAKPGLRTIAIYYEKYNSPENANQQLQIKYLTMKGTEFTDYECHKCKQGFSQEGSDRCSLCAKNFFLNPQTGECIQCPDGTFREEGSIGIDPSHACVVKKNCSFEEIGKTYDKQCTFQNNSLYKQYKINSMQNDQCNNVQDFQTQDIGLIQCGPCNDGQYFNMISNNFYQCSDCQEGTYLDHRNKFIQGDNYTFDMKCLSCPAGKFIEKGTALSAFESFPKIFSMSTQCLTKNIYSQEQSCIFSQGFIPIYNQGLSAGKSEDINSQIILKADTFIVGNSAYIEFEYQVNQFGLRENQLDNFSFYINNKLYLMKNGPRIGTLSDTKRTMFPLGLGDQYVKWVFNKYTQDSELMIKYIKVVGSSEGKQYNLDCLPCPKGYISSESGQTQCFACPIGYTSNSIQDKCEICFEGYYTPYEGSQCLKCSNNTVPSQDKTFCESTTLIEAEVTYDNKKLIYYPQFFSTVNASYSAFEGTFMFRVCKNEAAYCKKGFFGPVYSKQIEKYNNTYFNQFFISPVQQNDFRELSQIDLEDDDQDYRQKSFLIGLFDLNEVSQYQQQGAISKKDSDKCPLTYDLQGKNQKVIKSLGTHINKIDTQEDQYTIEYTEGDQCFYSQENFQNFRSEIKFICAKDEFDGWPVLKPQNQSAQDYDPCLVKFEWRSIFACRHCLLFEATGVSGQCIWNSRAITQNPGKTCQIYSKKNLERASVKDEDFSLFQVDQMTYEDCSPIDDVKNNTILLILLASILGSFSVLFISVGCIMCKYRNLSRTYYERVTLLNSNGVNRLSSDPNLNGSDNNKEGNEQNSQNDPPRQIIYKIGDEDED